MNESCGIGYCGKACCLCIENSHCDGCKHGDPYAHSWCETFFCCRNKCQSGCHQCVDFDTCKKDATADFKNHGFSKFIELFSEEELIEYLRRNERNGMLYHSLLAFSGDYDKAETEQELFQLIINGYISKES